MASRGSPSRKRVKSSLQSPGVSSQDVEQPNSLRSLWYPSVWPSKSDAVVAEVPVSCESVSMAQHDSPKAASISTTQLSSPRRQRHPSLQLTKRAGGSTRSLPACATTTRVNIASDGSTLTPPEEPPAELDTPGKPVDKEESNENPAIDSETTEKSKPDATGEPTDSTNSVSAANQSSGWLSWVYTPFTSITSTSNDPTPKPGPEQPPEPEESAVEQSPGQENGSESQNPSTEQQDKAPETAEIQPTSQKRSWLEMWYGSSSSKKPEESKEDTPLPPQEQSPVPVARPNPQDQEAGGASDGTATSNNNGARSSTWSLFFRDNMQGRPPDGQTDGQTVEANSTSDNSAAYSLKTPESGPGRNTENINMKSPPSGPPVSRNHVPKPTGVPEAAPPASLEASERLQKIIPNQVLPKFEDTFALQDRPTLLQSLGRFLHYNKEPNHQHVYKVAHPPRIKRALAIGIHGYFPAPLFRTVLGHPTGTSDKFSKKAAEAIQRYTEAQGYQCETQEIVLLGEGKVADRVVLLWKLLLNWMEQIRRADFILVACHSQGVPVALMLVAKLISFGCINANRVGICAMAGINVGPFPEYKSRWISGSAGELFEYAQPYSQVSKKYEAALRACIDFGVRISYIGSINDQLVPLESSLYTAVSHPYIYRAVFVDGRVHAPSFVSHLVGFALKLRNLGISDHGLIRELSTPLSGSLYTGDGHSRLYEEDAVYNVAIKFALETSPASITPLNIKRNNPPQTPNPYILPFAMRGLLEEEYVRHELFNETTELLKQFDEWNPTSKPLKDVKFRLEGIRSKL